MTDILNTPWFYENGVIINDRGYIVARLERPWVERDVIGPLLAAAPETAAERDRLREALQAILNALDGHNLVSLGDAAHEARAALRGVGGVGQ